jgi:hypothetical protein
MPANVTRHASHCQEDSFAAVENIADFGTRGAKIRAAQTPEKAKARDHRTMNARARVKSSRFKARKQESKEERARRRKRERESEGATSETPNRRRAKNARLFLKSKTARQRDSCLRSGKALRVPHCETGRWCGRGGGGRKARGENLLDLFQLEPARVLTNRD